MGQIREAVIAAEAKAGTPEEAEDVVMVAEDQPNTTQVLIIITFIIRGRPSSPPIRNKHTHTWIDLSFLRRWGHNLVLLEVMFWGTLIGDDVY